MAMTCGGFRGKRFFPGTAILSVYPSAANSGLSRKVSRLCHMKVRRFAQMPANRNNPGVHDTARQSRDREGALADYAAGMRSRSRLGLGLHGRPLLCRAPVSSGDAESALARVLQVLIQMAEAGELAGEAGS